MGPAGLEAHHDPVGVGLQQLRRKARHHVGLMHRRGDARFGGGLHHGEAGVASRAHHHVRAERAQNGPGLRRRAGQVIEGDQIMADLRGLHRAVEAGDMDGLEVVARLGDQVLFQSPVRSHEQKLGLRVLFRHELGQGNGGIHMPRRAAAGEQHPLQGFGH